MAKSMRSKKLKRLRAIRREMVAPIYDKKDEAKLAAQEAALAAPKLPVREKPSSSTSMELITNTPTTTSSTTMDVDIGTTNESLKAVGGVGKKSKRNFKVGKRKRGSKVNIRRKKNI